MALYEIKCINKQPRDNPYDRIDKIGINTSDGIKKFSVAEIVNFIDKQGHSFYVFRGSTLVYLEVATSPYGNKYVKTKDDNQPLNNLLSLPECN